MQPFLLALVAAAVIGVAGFFSFMYGLVPGTYRAALKGLRHKNRRVKTQAAKDLAKFKNVESISPLVRSLKVPDPHFRRACIDALGKIGKPAIEQLVQAFAQPDEELRFAAVEALCAINPIVSVEPLAKKLATTPAYMRRYIVEALVRIGVESLGPALKYAPDLGDSSDERAAEQQAKRDQFVDVLARLGEGNPDLLYQQSTGNDKQRLYVALALARHGDLRAPYLLTKLLSSRNSVLRTQALNALRDLRELAIDAVVEVLQDSNEAAKAGVVDLLVAIGGKAHSALAGLIQAEDPAVRFQAAVALGRMGQIKPLILVLWPKKPASVAKAIENGSKTRLELIVDQGCIKKAAEQALFSGKMSKQFRALYYLQALLIVLFPESVEAVDHPKIGKVLAYGGSVVENVGFLRPGHLHPVARRTLERPRRSRGVKEPLASAGAG